MRRRKPKVVWIPQTNANSIGDATRVFQSGILSFDSVAPASGQLELPLAIDFSVGGRPLDPTSTLADVEDSGYRLRRIVGKIWLIGSLSNPGGGGGAIGRCPAYIVTAGIIVRRIDQNTGGSLAVAATAASSFAAIDTQLIDNTADPWVWRRSWILGDPGAGNNPFVSTDTNGDGVNETPGITNFGSSYPGGIAEGPHVDQKTARIVGPEERLFLDVAATPLIDGTTGNTTAVLVLTDLRVLGSMRTTVGNRRNASR